jgi:Ca-activated chloride channel homolog
MYGVKFANPEFFLLLLVILPMLAWYVFRHLKSKTALQFSYAGIFGRLPRSYRIRFRHFPFVFRLLTLSALVVALARPYSTSQWEEVITEGIDIIITLDISTSMLAEDFKPNRLESAKLIATDFISGRRTDRLGLVIFSGETFTMCPLTSDHAVLKNLLMSVKTGMIEDGTAIGMGLANAVNRLKAGDSQSKIVILLTDGVNNRGSIAPVTAAEIAREFGVRVYTIGVGTVGTAPYPVQTPFGRQYQQIEVDLDEPVLMEIAAITGGSYFRATDEQKLKEIYREIEQMEKSRTETREFVRRKELFLPFMLLAGLFVMLEILLNTVVLRKIP